MPRFRNLTDEGALLQPSEVIEDLERKEKVLLSELFHSSRTLLFSREHCLGEREKCVPFELDYLGKSRRRRKSH